MIPNITLNKRCEIMRREQMVTTEEKLLFDMLQELKEINQKLTVRSVAKGAECKKPKKEGA